MIIRSKFILMVTVFRGLNILVILNSRHNSEPLKQVDVTLDC